MDRPTDIKQQTQENQLPDQKKVIPVLEEQLKVGKQVVESGSLLISKTVREENVSVDVPVMHSEHEVERVAVNQYVDSPPPVRYEGNTMIIPILQEVVVLEKRLVLVEELRVTAHQVQTQETQQVTLRKEEVSVERNNKTDKDINYNQTDTNQGVEINIVPKNTDA